MRTQKFTLSLVLCALFLSLPFLSISQVDFSKFNVFDDEIVEDIQITPEQVQQIKAIENEYGDKKRDINNALLYHEDYKVELDQIYENRNTAVQKVLNSEQIEAYKNRISGAKLLRTNGTGKDLKVKFLDDYSYLALTEKQAEELVQVCLSMGLENGKMSKETRLKVMKSLLTKPQLKQYKKSEKGQSKYSGLLPFSAMNETEKIAQMKAKIQLFEEDLLPQRSYLRNQFEDFIDAEDQEKIEYLRTKYQEKISPKKTKKQRRQKGANSPSKDYWRAYKKLYLLEKSNLTYYTPTVSMMVQNDRETFEIAKELAVKYDEKIDLYEAEIRTLHSSIINKVKSNPINGIRYLRLLELPNKYAVETNYPNNKKEMYFNVAFLLINADASKSDETTVGNSFLKAYPMPAQEHQIIEYIMEKDGEITFEIIDVQGKVLKVIYQGEANEGLHKHRVELDDISDRIFFYRLTTKDGSSILKSMKF